MHNFIGYNPCVEEDGITTSGVDISATVSTDVLDVNFWNNTLAYLDHGVDLVDFVTFDVMDNIISWTMEAVTSTAHYPPIGPSITGYTNLIYMTNRVALPNVDLIVTDPKLVDPNNGDLHLRLDSPALDRAVDLGLVTDVDGDKRPISLPDIGADEAGGKTYLPLITK
jgi:hypothetical protein